MESLVTLQHKKHNIMMGRVKDKGKKVFHGIFESRNLRYLSLDVPFLMMRRVFFSDQQKMIKLDY